MDVSFELQCPVCRARQTVRKECRRCGADLGLYALALRSLTQALGRRAEALARGDRDQVTGIDEYLRWLDPQQGA